MKLPLLFTGLLFSAVSPGWAQMPGSVANVIFNLTLSYSKEGTVMKDETTGKPITGKDEFGDPLGGPAFYNMWTITKTKEIVSEDTPDEYVTTIVSEDTYEEYVSKIGTRKYGNKEFLMDLVENGVLPEIGNAPFIAGWTLVQVTGTFDEGDEFYTGPDVIYAVHAGEDITVLLSGVVIERDYDVRSGYAENWNYKYVNKVNYPKETDTTTITETGSWKSVRRYIIDFEGLLEWGDYTESTAQFQGIYTNTEKLAKVRTGDPENPEAGVYQCGPSKLDKISGSGPYYGEEAFDREVIEGTLSTAAGKLSPDISEQFPEAAEFLD